MQVKLKFFPYFPLWEIEVNFESIGYYIIMNYQEDMNELLHFAMARIYLHKLVLKSQN